MWKSGQVLEVGSLDPLLSPEDEIQVVMLDRVDSFTEPSQWPREHLYILGFSDCHFISLPVYMCTTCCPQRPEVSVRSQRAGVTNACELLSEY